MQSLIILLASMVWTQTGAQETITLPMEQIEKEIQEEGEGTEGASDKQPGKAVEKIVVTGSHIRRIEVEGPSPVQVLDKKALQQTGYNSVADVLRDTTASSFGGSRERSGSNAAGVAEVSLRGLGSDRTLVLLNGKRLPTDAVTGGVDLNLIPMAAVERIEILKDGASAIYGSDALAGVVNIITKKDYSGNEISYTQTVPQEEGGAKKEISLVGGVTRGKFHMVNVVYYRDNETIFSRDRFWSDKGESLLGSPGKYRAVNPDGTTGSWVADANCPAGQIRMVGSGTHCAFKYSDYSTTLPSLEQISLMNESSYKLGKTDLSLRLNATQKNGFWQYAPAPDIFRIDSSLAQTLGPGGGPLPGVAPGQSIDAGYRLVELGNRQSEIDEKAYGVALGLKRPFLETWEWELTSSYNEVGRRDEGISGYALKNELENLIATGQFNPFASPGGRGSLASAAYKPWQQSISRLAQVELKSSGEVGEMSGGPLGLAVGFNGTTQSYEDNFDKATKSDLVFGSAGSSGGGDRQTTSLFTELGMPITEKLEFQMAARYDNYSDFGDTVNPKLALRYQAHPTLMMRASAGTGFKAPTMTELYEAASYGYPTFIDHVSCRREKALDPDNAPSCKPAQYLVRGGGNKNLNEEKSVSYNGGIVFQPTPDHATGFDLWLTKIDNAVGLSLGDAMKAEAAGKDLSQNGISVTRDTDGYITSIEAPLQNLAAQEAFGFDVTQEIQEDTEVGRLKLKIEHSQMIWFKQEGYPGMGFKNIIGESGVPAWRRQVSLAYLPTAKQEALITASTIDGYKKDVKEEGFINEYTSVDVRYSVDGFFKGKIAAGVKNVFGSVPPLDDSNPNDPLNTALYDQIGRQYYVTYSQRF